MLVFRVFQMLSISVVASVLFACSGAFPVKSMDEGVPAVQSENKDKSWFQDRVHEHVKSLEINGDSAHIVTSGFFYGDSELKTTDFSLKVKDKIYLKRDHHSKTDLEVDSLSLEKGVMVKYRREFDHRSFGKNQLDIDQGRFLIPLKSPNGEEK